MNKILTPIIAAIFSGPYSVKLIFTFRFIKEKCEITTEKDTIETSIKKTNHLGIYLNSLILKTFPILQINLKILFLFNSSFGGFFNKQI
ncbi:hypothetical protein [Chryseobacterium soldanellicola]|uniref:hypothetical protein n=1 Tax=Chryseobacterium soldanellicola TaxID=311333 RepID=UPI001E376774|nr:hypothetical protein [Chryseobacterium soldanellicola]